MLRVILALLLVPLFDILLLVGVATYLGAAPTVLLVVLTALLGLLLVRAEGRHTVRKIQSKFAQGEVPTDELIDGGLLLVAGALLLTPGLVTDLLGLVLVVPVTRYPVRWATKKWVVVPALDKRTGGFASGNVYIGGFPGDAEPTGGRAGQGGQGGQTGSRDRSGETYDVDDDAYDIDLEDDEDERED